MLRFALRHWEALTDCGIQEELWTSSCRFAAASWEFTHPGYVCRVAVWNTWNSLLPPRPDPGWAEDNGWMDITFYSLILYDTFLFCIITELFFSLLRISSSFLLISVSASFLLSSVSINPSDVTLIFPDLSFSLFVWCILSFITVQNNPSWGEMVGGGETGSCTHPQPAESWEQQGQTGIRSLFSSVPGTVRRSLPNLRVASCHQTGNWLASHKWRVEVRFMFLETASNYLISPENVHLTHSCFLNHLLGPKYVFSFQEVLKLISP